MAFTSRDIEDVVTALHELDGKIVAVLAGVYVRRFPLEMQSKFRASMTRCRAEVRAQLGALNELSEHEGPCRT